MLEKRLNSYPSQGYIHGFESRMGHHIETTGLIPKISVLFSFYRAISLVLGINCLIFGEVAFFSLRVLKASNLSKARTDYQKHEYTLTLIFWPSAVMLVVFFMP